MEWNEVLTLAREAAREAAEVHRRHLGQVRVEAWSEKGVADFVTHVDREAEERIVGLVRGRFPEHAILAEEETEGVLTPANLAGRKAPEWLWVVDPLDGTTNFLHRYPMYAASVAVLHRGEPVAGVVHCGATGEAWWAVRDGGAYRDGERLRVSGIERLPLALIGTGFPFKAKDRIPTYMRQFEAVLRGTAGIRRAGSAALDLCHLATGYFDGFWELDLFPWDFAAGALVVREAGGVATAPDGGPLDLLSRGGVLAGNPAVHGALLELLGDAG